MINQVEDVAIELGSFKNIEDRHLLEDESSQEDEAYETARSKWYKLLEEVLNPNDQNHSRRKSRFVPKWDVIFTVSSAFAVFIDPLICYIPVIIENRAWTCYLWDQKLLWTFIALRSAGDILYTLDIVVFLKRSRTKGKANSKSIGPAWIKLFGGHDTRVSKLLNRGISLMLLGLLPRICAALPILQAIILITNYSFLDNSTLIYLIPIQYSLRAYNLYRWLYRHAQIDTAIRRLLKAILDFLPFILAANIFGALWYYFAVTQEILCWQANLRNPVNNPTGYDTSFYCDRSTELIFDSNGFDMTFLKKTCATQVSKDAPTIPFDFGIYLYAIQSGLTRSRNLSTKILQCFWWGLRHLSSFGSNLQTSFYKDEIIFSIVISISGLTLFLVYLNARVQGWQKIADQHKLRKKMDAVYADIIDQVRVMYRLRLASLKKVPMLQGVNEKVLRAICEHLKPVTYGDDFFIIREGELVRKMIFITRGSALMYANSNGGTHVCTCLERNDSCGQELLNWAFKFASFSELPISTRTVLCQTKVEAFSITANHLNSVVAEFWWHFKKDLTSSQLEQFAASFIQAAWRRHYARRAGSQLATGPDE